MILLLYILVCGFEFRLFNLYELIDIAMPGGRLNLEDMLLFILLVVTMPAYYRKRQQLTSAWFRRVECAWLVFVGVLFVATINSPADSLTQRLGQLRFVQPYLLFFPTVAVVDSRRRLRFVIIVGLIFALIGTVLTVVQSLYGLKNIVDSPLYSIGSWPGNKQMVGGLARVNLPISNWVAFVLLVLVAVLLHRWKWWAAFLGIFLALSLYLNFARSLWLGMVAAVVVEVFLAYWTRLLTPQAMMRLMGIITVLIVAVALSPLVGIENLGGALIERMEDGFHIFRTVSGNWGERLSQMNWVLDYLQKSDWTVWLFGVGTHYRSVTGFFIDLGFPATLMSIGIIGLIALFWLLFVCALSGYRAMKSGVEMNSELVILAGLAVPAQVMLMLIYQQWLIPSVASILSFSSAIALAIPNALQEADVTVSRYIEDSREE